MRHGALQVAPRSMGTLRGRRPGVGRDRHRCRRSILLGRRPEEVRARDHQVPGRDRGEGHHRGQRVPPRRRHPRRAAQLAALQAGRRGRQRVLHRRRHGDARGLRHPRCVPGSEVRRHGTQARVVRGRRNDRAPAAPDPVGAGDGIPPVRRPRSGRARARDGFVECHRSPRRADGRGARGTRSAWS